MLRSRRLFDFPALYTLFDKNVITKIEAEDDAEAASYGQLVVAAVGVRPHVRLDEIVEVHEPIASFVDQHLCMVEGKPWMRALIKTPNLVFLPHRRKRCVELVPYH